MAKIGGATFPRIISAADCLSFRAHVISTEFLLLRCSNQKILNAQHINIYWGYKLEAQHNKLDADLRTCALLGTPSVQSGHDYYPVAMEDGGRLAHVAAELVDHLAILVVVRQFPCMGAADSRSLRSNIYVRM
jgi:hypothetical protein